MLVKVLENRQVPIDESKIFSFILDMKLRSMAVVIKLLTFIIL